MLCEKAMTNGAVLTDFLRDYIDAKELRLRSVAKLVARDIRLASQIERADRERKEVCRGKRSSQSSNTLASNSTRTRMLSESGAPSIFSPRLTPTHDDLYERGMIRTEERAQAPILMKQLPFGRHPPHPCSFCHGNVENGDFAPTRCVLVESYLQKASWDGPGPRKSASEEEERAHEIYKKEFETALKVHKSFFVQSLSSMLRMRMGWDDVTISDWESVPRERVQECVRIIKMRDEGVKHRLVCRASACVLAARLCDAKNKMAVKKTEEMEGKDSIVVDDKKRVREGIELSIAFDIFPIWKMYMCKTLDEKEMLEVVSDTVRSWDWYCQREAQTFGMATALIAMGAPFLDTRFSVITDRFTAIIKNVSEGHVRIFQKMILEAGIENHSFEDFSRCVKTTQQLFSNAVMDVVMAIFLVQWETQGQPRDEVGVPTLFFESKESLRDFDVSSMVKSIHNISRSQNPVTLYFERDASRLGRNGHRFGRKWRDDWEATPSKEVSVSCYPVPLKKEESVADALEAEEEEEDAAEKDCNLPAPPCFWQQGGNVAIAWMGAATRCNYPAESANLVVHCDESFPNTLGKQRCPTFVSSSAVSLREAPCPSQIPLSSGKDVFANPKGRMAANKLGQREDSLKYAHLLAAANFRNKRFYPEVTPESRAMADELNRAEEAAKAAKAAKADKKPSKKKR